MLQQPCSKATLWYESSDVFLLLKLEGVEFITLIQQSIACGSDVVRHPWINSLEPTAIPEEAAVSGSFIDGYRA